MSVWIAVAVGGALGSAARYGVNLLAAHTWPALRFPLATLIVNMTGCVVIGALAGLMAAGQFPPRVPWREFVFVGVLGGFTTFSAFALETMVLARAGDGPRALLNVVLQVIGGLVAVWVGLAVVERLGGVR